METIVNKVAQSGLVTLNLEDFLPQKDALAELDITPFLFKGLILREKDFRAELLTFNWSEFEGKQVAVYCSADAIIPMWAYMLIAVYLKAVNATSFFGTKEEMNTQLLLENIKSSDFSSYTDARLVIKGCGDIPLPESAFLLISERLLPIVKTLMYGEPCSTVPIYKKK